MPADETLVPPPLKAARWIWPENQHWDLHNCYALFRRPFTLKSLPRRAPLFITADQSYLLYVNGGYLCRGPARGFQQSWPYDEVDLRPFLRKGRNILAVRAHNPGRSNFLYIHQSYAGLLVAAPWGGTQILTDETWKCRRQSGINRNTVPGSLQLFDQEAIDLREEDPAWTELDFDDTGWTSIVYSRPWNALPWPALEPRGLPMLEEKIVRPVSVAGEAEGKNAPDHLATRNLAVSRHREGLSHRACAHSAETLHFSPTESDVWKSFLIDFGKIVVGSVELEITGALGGEVVETFHSETIDAATREPDFLPETHCRMAFANRLICRKAGNRHMFFHPLGFRYVVLTVRGNTRKLTVSLRLRTAIYPLEQKGAFTHSDPTLNAIWRTCAWTQRICTLDAYVDTPWREQAQWWGDARVQAANTFYYSGDTRVFRRGIRQIATQTTPEGLTYGHAPTMAHNCVLPDFTLIWMATLWDYYWQTGSLEPFLEHNAVVHRALEYFQSWLDPRTGLLCYDHRHWLFLDWADLQKEGSSSLYSLWLLYVLDRLTALAKRARRFPEASRWEDWAERLRKALLPLLTPEGLFRDGILADGKINAECSVHTQTLALMTRLAPRHESAMLRRVLLPFIRNEADFRAQPSAYWITYVYALLIERGHETDVLAHLRERWAPMAKFGSTSERFQLRPGFSSRSHAWAAHPLYHLMKIAGGVYQSDAGWRKIDYRPVFPGKRAEVRIPTPLGPIVSRWKRTGKEVEAQLELPKGVSARIILPGRKRATVTGNHRFHLTPP